MLLDPSLPQATYIEDCEVCCRPIQFTASFNNQTELISFSAEDI